ncbi:phosphoadenylyl-sulfate reductase [bacterium]|nr:phosphoadenylyl-sulfate reductase [bacterium]
MRVSPGELPFLGRTFRTRAVGGILRWVEERFGDGAVVLSSFQTQSLPLLHHVSRVVPDMPVLFIDTGFHFPETLQFRDRVAHLLRLNLQVVFVPRTDDCPAAPLLDGTTCCRTAKTRTAGLIFQRYDAVVSGVRRDQTVLRTTLPVLQRQRGGAFKVHPMLDWTADQVHRYIQRYNLPVHPLTHAGYRSIGCAPCTRPADPGMGDRSGRWTHSERTECGLHTEFQL